MISFPTFRPRVHYAVFAPVLALLFLSSCSTDPEGPAAPVDKGNGGLGPDQGQFFDSPVQGLEFASGDRSGTTDRNGVFSFEDGQDIAFGVGDIALGSAPPAKKMNPLHLAHAKDAMDSVVTNLARFLQTIDDDGNPLNGIRITRAVRAAAVGKTVNFFQGVDAFGSDPNVQTVVADLTSVTPKGQRPLVDASEARSRLEAGIRSGFLGDYSGRYCQDLEGGSQADGGLWAMRVDADGKAKLEFAGSATFSVTCIMTLGGIVVADDPDAGVQLCGFFGPDFRGRWRFGEMAGSYSERASCGGTSPASPPCGN